MHRAEHVVVHAFDHVVLDERHVLVRGGVIHGLDVVRLEHLAHAVAVMRGADQRDDLDVQRLVLRQVLERLIDRVERRFRDVEQHEPLRAERRDLEAELRADRPAGARDHDGLAANAGVEQLRVRRHGVAAEKVRDIHFADIVDVSVTRGEIGPVGHRLHVHGQVLELVDDVEAPPARHRRQREQHARHAELFDQTHEVLRRMHGEAVDHGVAQRGVVVDERHRHEVAAALERRDEVRAGLAGAVDHDAIAGRVPRLEQPTHGQASADDVDHAEQPERRGHARGVGPGVDRGDREPEHERDQRQRPERRRDELEAHEADHGPVEPGEAEAGHTDDRRDQPHPARHGQDVGPDKPNGYYRAGGQRDAVGQPHDETLGAAG